MFVGPLVASCSVAESLLAWQPWEILLKICFSILLKGRPMSAVLSYDLISTT